MSQEAVRFADDTWARCSGGDSLNRIPSPKYFRKRIPLQEAPTPLENAHTKRSPLATKTRGSKHGCRPNITCCVPEHVEGSDEDPNRT